MSSGRKRYFSHIHNADLAFPKSLFDGWHPPAPIATEGSIIAELPLASDAEREHGYRMVDISDFAIYRSPKATLRPGELVPLTSLRTDPSSEVLHLNACVHLGQRKSYLESIPFSTLAIDGYGDTSTATVRHGISIQTPLAAKHNIWYRLLEPAQEYRRYHTVFLWVADLAKLSVEFMSLSDDRVCLQSFKHDLVRWATETYGADPSFAAWLGELKGTDFRSAISAHMQFLWKEAYSVDSEMSMHPLWTEIDPVRLKAIQAFDDPNIPTIVTPFALRCFRHMYFGPILQTEQESPNNLILADRRREQLGLTSLTTIDSEVPKNNVRPHTGQIAQGDFVCLKPDTNTKWTGKCQDYWYAYVQSTRTLKNGQVKLDLLWLYAPSDTTIGDSPYPFQNELFLSDNCACGSDAYAEEEIVGKINVVSGMDPAKAQKLDAFILRQTYMTHTHEFVTLDSSHLSCNCRKPPPDAFTVACEEYKRGDFVLYRSDTAQNEDDLILRPAQILGFLPVQKLVFLRLLHSVAEEGDRSTINEVQWSEETLTVKVKQLVRNCIVTGFSERSVVDKTYLRGGIGDHFYYIYMGNDPNSYAANPPESGIPSKLRGMGICCGGGSLDRGIEDGGAVEFRHAIDYDDVAIHTYRANTDEPDKINFFLGPMERYLKGAITGIDTSYEKAAIGDIDMIAAGSPCQAFTLLQPDRFSDISIKHASLVASVMSYMDHFMPLYLVFENVLGISTVPKGLSSDQNILSTMLGCLVGLGYQTQQIILDVPAFNGFQSRRRVFVLAAAPGLEPLSRPPQTSLRPEFRNSSLGRLSNGLRLAGLQDDLAPFPTTTFAAATADLPALGDGHVGACLRFPDHRVARPLSYDQRALIAHIPPGMALATAHANGKLPPAISQRWAGALRGPARKKNHAFGRVHADGLMGAVMTRVIPNDRFAGRVLHPTEDRILTVLEARRAQGWPDDEVVLGSPAQAWKIVGNGVHRNVAYALGLELGKAMERSGKTLKRLTGTKKRKRMT